MIATKLMTAEELIALPKDGFRYELIKGELRKKMPAGGEHGFLAMRVGWRLAQHVETHDLGRVYAAETGFKLEVNPDTVLAPDGAFISKRKLLDSEAKGFLEVAPDLVVEVISPNDVYTEVEEKVAAWLEYGVIIVVVVNPRQRTVKVHRSLTDVVILTRQDVLKLEDILPGWQLEIQAIFAV
jgi:Uma2 family endonuclease